MNKNIISRVSLCLVLLCAFALLSCTQQQTPANESQTPQARETLTVANANQEATTRGDQKSNYSPAYEALMTKLAFLSPPSSSKEPFIVKIGTEKPYYRIGEPLEARFGANKECYLTIMDISTTGEITFLTPSAKVPHTKIAPNRVYSTLHDFDMKIIVGPPDGVETINVFCSSEKIALFETDFDQEKFYTIAPMDAQRLDALSANLDRLQQTTWNGNSIQFEIVPPGARPAFASSTEPQQPGELSSIADTDASNIFFPPIGATGTAGKNEITGEEVSP